MAIGNALLDMWKEMQNEISIDNDEPEYVEEQVKSVEHKKVSCPQCGEPLRHEGGCIQCPSCGWSKCD